LEIRFRTNTLRRQYEKVEEANRAYGRDVARKYIQRVNIIKCSRNLHELRLQRTLRCHELKGDRRGQWSMRLTVRWRLIFTVEGEALEIARIEEVSKHYGD